MNDKEEFLNLAVETALKAGELLIDYLGNIECVEDKGVGDLVTEADRDSESLVVEAIKKALPDHGIVGEEGSGFNLNSEYCWLIDPLDATFNYAHGFPIFDVSIGLLKDGVPVVGAVYDPLRDKMFCASDGNGAYLNEDLLQVSDTPKLTPTALFAVSTAIVENELMPGTVKYMQKIFSNGSKCRSIGCAALSLCYTAEGVFDGYIDMDIKAWDIAASGLILLEAGGEFTYLSGEPVFPLKGEPKTYSNLRMNLLGTNGKIHGQILESMGK